MDLSEPDRLLTEWLRICLLIILCYVFFLRIALCKVDADLKGQVGTRVVYHLYFNPLAKYPGPLLSKFSSIPSFYHAIKRDRHIWIWQCFQIYGIPRNPNSTPQPLTKFKSNSIIGSKFRSGPHTILYNSPSAFRDIYSAKANVKKSPNYDAWKRNEGDSNVLNTTDVVVHARKRRVLNTVFTDKLVRSATPFIIKHIDRWNEILLGSSGYDWSEPTDMSRWTECLVLDVMTDLCFGKSVNIKEPGENPFKLVPDGIVSWLKLFHPVN